MRAKVVVSSCLLGERCRYNGEQLYFPKIDLFLEGKEVISLCPEVTAGFGTPRNPIQIQGRGGSDILDGDGEIKDGITGRVVTEDLLNACRHLAASLEELNRKTTTVLLKERSPSCGVRQTHTDGGVIQVPGLFGEICLRMGFSVITEEDIEEIQ